MKSYFPLLLTILLCCSSCSRKNEKNLFGEAQTAYDQKKYQESVTLYQEIVDRFPASVYADSSLMRIAAIYNNEIHDYRKALQSYQKYYQMFPASNDAPTALFLSGFLFNNELHMLDSAGMVYEKFLQKYPSHQLAQSAKFELSSLGKDPTQFIGSQDSVTSAPH
jgi:outer membrane protein assembly factor BamD (BamD/ComL family)